MTEFDSEAFEKRLRAAIGDEAFQKAAPIILDGMKTHTEDFVKESVQKIAQVRNDVIDTARTAAIEYAKKYVDQAIQKAFTDRRTQLKAIASTPSATTGQSSQPKNGGGMESFREIWDQN